jgi:hypothetical protein
MSGDVRTQVQGPALARYEVARILDTDGNVAPAPLLGQTFFYFGKCVSAFKEAFAQVRFVVTP